MHRTVISFSVLLALISITGEQPANTNTFQAPEPNQEYSSTEYNAGGNIEIGNQTEQNETQSDINSDKQNNSISHKIEEIEYDNELRAISQVLGIEYIEADNKTLNSLRSRLTYLIDKVKQDQEEDSGETKNLTNRLQNALNTLKQVTGKNGLQNLRLFRHQMENISDTLTDEITNIVDHLKPQITIFGDTFSMFIEKCADGIVNVLKRLKTNNTENSKNKTTSTTKIQ